MILWTHNTESSERRIRLWCICWQQTLPNKYIKVKGRGGGVEVECLPTGSISGVNGNFNFSLHINFLLQFLQHSPWTSGFPIFVFPVQFAKLTTGHFFPALALLSSSVCKLYKVNKCSFCLCYLSLSLFEPRNCCSVYPVRKKPVPWFSIHDQHWRSGDMNPQSWNLRANVPTMFFKSAIWTISSSSKNLRFFSFSKTAIVTELASSVLGGSIGLG